VTGERRESSNGVALFRSVRCDLTEAELDAGRCPQGCGTLQCWLGGAPRWRTMKRPQPRSRLIQHGDSIHAALRRATFVLIQCAISIPRVSPRPFTAAGAAPGLPFAESDLPRGKSAALVAVAKS
jgi:hypothetical protein